VRVVQLDIGVWFTRPLTRKILDAAAKNVQHFCQLRTVLVEKLLDGIGLTAGIDCYLGSVRDLSDEQYDDYCHQQVYCPVGYTHTHTRLTTLCPGLVLPFWYRLTQVVLEKRPLNGSSSTLVMYVGLCTGETGLVCHFLNKTFPDCRPFIRKWQTVITVNGIF